MTVMHEIRHSEDWERLDELAKRVGFESLTQLLSWNDGWNCPVEVTERHLKRLIDDH